MTGCRLFYEDVRGRRYRSWSPLRGPWNESVGIGVADCSRRSGRVSIHSLCSERCSHGLEREEKLHRERLHQVYQFLTREVIEDRSRPVCSGFPRDPQSGLDGIVSQMEALRGYGAEKGDEIALESFGYNGLRKDRSGGFNLGELERVRSGDPLSGGSRRIGFRSEFSRSQERWLRSRRQRVPNDIGAEISIGLDGNIDPLDGLSDQGVLWRVNKPVERVACGG